jgi:hypothetical protein
MGKGSGSGSKVYDYFGTIAGAVCAGPVDELVSILVDGKIVWPTATVWASGVSVTTGALRSYLGTVYEALTNHTTSSGNRPPTTTHWARYTAKRATSSNPLALTVEGYGQAFLYWGTSAQNLDTVSEKVMNLNGHPPYRRQCFIVLKDFLFGRERTSAPNIEAIVRRKPNQTVVTGSAANLSDGQANPVSALAELYTDPVFGAGLTTDSPGGPDSTTWQAAADALDAVAANTALSPVLTKGTSLRQFTAELLAYCDGWLRFNAAGEIEAGRFPHNAAPPSFAAATTIDFHDLIDEAAYTADGWAATYNQTQVKFSDRSRSYKDGSVSSVSGWNLAVTSEPRTLKVDRPWITRRDQATAYAAELGKINAEPRMAGTLSVRAEKATGIRTGDLFLLTHDAVGMSVVCRCTGKDSAQPPAGRVTIRFEADRASAPVPYQPTAAPDDGSPYPANETLSLQQFFQPPPRMIDDTTDATLVPLVARTSPLTVGANAWLKVSDASGFYNLGGLGQFAITGTLAFDYPATITANDLNSSSRSRASNVATVTLSGAHQLVPGMVVDVVEFTDDTFNGRFTIIATPSSTSFTYANTGSNVSTTSDTAGIITPTVDDVTETFRVTLDGSTVAADLAKMTATQTEDAVNDNAVAVIVFDQSDAKNFEVLTLRTLRVLGAETYYRARVRRARFGTSKRAAVTGDPVWIVYRADLVALSHASFPAYLEGAQTATLRLQAINAEAVADLADAALCPDISYTFNDPYAPVLTFDSVKAAGTEITDFATNYATTTDFAIRATITDASADLIEARLFARLGTTEVQLWAQTFTESSRQTVTTTFRLPSNGEWRVYLSGRDRSGRLKQKELTAGGGSSTVTLKIGVGTGSTTVATPSASPDPGGYTTNNRLVTLACSTSGATIKYSVTAIGAAPGTYSTYSGAITLSIGAGAKTIHAYAEKAGLTTSAVVALDYWKEVSEYLPPGTQLP